MAVVRKPETGEGSPPPPQNQKPAPPQPGDPLFGGGGWWVRGKETKVGFLAGRFAFIAVGTMLIIATLISFFMLWVSLNEPYLQPNVIDDTLHVNKVYLQIDGENGYRELAIGNQPITLDPIEITQLSSGKAFKIIFTPKQLDVPEHYRIYNKATGEELAGGLTRQSSYLKNTVDGNFYTLTTTATNSTDWKSGRYEIELPDAGMFGGKLYAYFIITEK